MEALGSIPTGIGSERAQLFRVLAEVGEYAMTLLWTSASLAVELRGDRRFQPAKRAKMDRQRAFTAAIVKCSVTARSASAHSNS